MDICCGTGDLLLALAKERAGAMGKRFLPSDAVLAKQKIARRRARAALFRIRRVGFAGQRRLARPGQVAFGFRNLANYEAGLHEIRRVLPSRWTAAILEFSNSAECNVCGDLSSYSRRVLPWIGGMISGSQDAYRYLPESVRKFPGAKDLAGKMREAGFSEVEFEYLTGGIVALHLGRALETSNQRERKYVYPGRSYE